MNQVRAKILWADDEIDLLKPHQMYLQEKGYDVTGVTNGPDAVEEIRNDRYDLVLLDEMMPGQDGLETLTQIKETSPGLPVIMITKNEEESLMEEAIGSKISDYLTKPVNPSQILLACKKALEQGKISGEQVSKSYINEFNRISQLLMSGPDIEEWSDLHFKLSQWEVEFDDHPDLGLNQTLTDQKKECNVEFGKFVEKRYADWVTQERGERPNLSLDVVPEHVKPLLDAGKKVVFIVIDCMRLDQWLTIEPMLYPYYRLQKNYYYSLLPTATPYARNAIFSGLFPSELPEYYPEIWQKAEDDDMSMNRHEHELLDRQLKRLGMSLDGGSKYVKVLDAEEGRSVERNIKSMSNIPLISLVINFVDILAHRRSESEFLQEMVPDEAGYRTIVRAWFEHSWLFQVLKQLSDSDYTIVLTTDHGSIRVQNPAKVKADRDASTNLRYKYGRNLNASQKQAVFVGNPEDFKLPRRGVNSTYLLAKEDYYFVYPTNYNRYRNKFYDTFQHGGISLEEMILPVVTLEPKG
ncbi:MAG: response regulator [Candidatus Marinimicrobia bacterium]|nr:response regulator [Candidatus Neomarinimicrobiota bacterium]MCF7829808.1 response regulator [Candidatus Neomarinimicrobiota bacterium]MCF7881759.1 response regulator [Candidatus Neomarinimicrobiota bacterium]